MASVTGLRSSSDPDAPEHQRPAKRKAISLSELYEKKHGASGRRTGGGNPLHDGSNRCYNRLDHKRFFRLGRGHRSGRARYSSLA